MNDTPRVISIPEPERERRAQIDDLYTALSGSPSAQHIGPEKIARARANAILDGSTVEQAREKFKQVIDDNMEPAQPVAFEMYRGGGQVGNMEPSELNSALADALVIRSGFKLKDAHPAARDFTGLSLLEMYRTSLAERDASVRGLNRQQLFDHVRGFVGVGTSVLTDLLADAINKMVRTGLDQSPVTWRDWIRHSEVPDFKTIRRIGLGRTSGLDHVPENAEYKHTALTDDAETFNVSKYGKILALTREAILNDDLGELSSVPQVFVDSASAKLSDLVYDALQTSTMADGQVLCHSSHNNVGTAGALSTTTLDELISLMRKQTNQSGDYMNITPRHLIVPPDLEGVARVLINATSMNYEAGGSTSAVTGVSAAPSLYGDLQLVVEPRVGSTSYFLISGSTPAVELATIGGDGISIESQPGWETDGIAYKVRLEAGAQPIEYRGAAKNTTV